MDAANPQAAQGCAGCATLREQVAELEVLVLQLQRQVHELQGRLDQNSSNSHKPPSSDPPWSGNQPAARKPTGRKPGGQIGHKGHHRLRLPPERVDEVVRHVPEHCRHCHASLPVESGPDDPQPSWHQVAELPALAARVTEHQGLPACVGVAAGSRVSRFPLRCAGM